MNGKTVTVSGIILLAFTLGYFLPSPLTIKRSPIGESSTLRSEEMNGKSNQRTETTLSEFAKEAASDPESSIIGSRKAKGVLLREFLLEGRGNGIEWFSFDVFDARGEITDVFAELYGLSEGEIKALNDEAEKVREEHFQLVIVNSKVTSLEDGSIDVVVSSFEGAEELYSRILDTFEALGKERFSDFLKLGERELREHFNHFGGEELNVTVNSRIEEIQDPSGNSTESIRYEVSESRGSSGQSSSRVLNNLTTEKYAQEFSLVKRLIEETQPHP